jgi:hypothetical protein
MQILALAHDSEELPEDVVKRAKKYYAWLTKPENGTAPVQLPS